MKLPRDLSGTEVARRHTHREVRVGTLDAIIADVAAFPSLPKRAVCDTLFN